MCNKTISFVCKDTAYLTWIVIVIMSTPKGCDKSPPYLVRVIINYIVNDKEIMQLGVHHPYTGIIIFIYYS